MGDGREGLLWATLVPALLSVLHSSSPLLAFPAPSTLRTNSTPHLNYTNWTCEDTQVPCNLTDGFVCLPPAWICDKAEDCEGKEDEVECAGECGEGEVACADGRCVPAHSLCDGDLDCLDHSDEANCTAPPTTPRSLECGALEFGCESNVGAGRAPCVPVGWKCDGEDDCVGGEDERGCGRVVRRECKRGFVACASHCIPDRWRCDGEGDCGDKRDEANCTAASPAPPHPIPTTLSAYTTQRQQITTYPSYDNETLNGTMDIMV